MIAKMKSLCGSESRPHFSRLAPSPSPSHPPSARAYRPWRGCRAAPNSLVSATEPDVEPPEPVGARDDEGDRHPDEGDTGEARTTARAPPRRTAPPRRWPRGPARCRGRAPSTTARDAHGRDGHEVGHEDVAEGVEALALRREDQPTGEHQAHLDDLGRLDVDRPSRSQFWLPLTSTPIGVRTSSWSTMPTDEDRQGQPLPARDADPRGDHERDPPIAAKPPA